MHALPPPQRVRRPQRQGRGRGRHRGRRGRGGLLVHARVCMHGIHVHDVHPLMCIACVPASSARRSSRRRCSSAPRASTPRSTPSPGARCCAATGGGATCATTASCATTRAAAARRATGPATTPPAGWRKRSPTAAPRAAPSAASSDPYSATSGAAPLRSTRSARASTTGRCAGRARSPWTHRAPCAMRMRIQPDPCMCVACTQVVGAHYAPPMPPPPSPPAEVCASARGASAADRDACRCGFRRFPGVDNALAAQVRSPAFPFLLLPSPSFSNLL